MGLWFQKWNRFFPIYFSICTISSLFLLHIMAAAWRKCLNSPNAFFYRCGSFILPSQKIDMSEFVKKMYLAYFQVWLGDQDKSCSTSSIQALCWKFMTVDQGKARKIDIWHSNGMPRAEKPCRWLQFLPGQDFRSQKEK